MRPTNKYKKLKGMKGLCDSETNINKNLLIRVHYEDGKTEVIRVRRLVELIGLKTANNFVKRVYNDIHSDEKVCKLRRGWEIHFLWI